MRYKFERKTVIINALFFGMLGCILIGDACDSGPENLETVVEHAQEIPEEVDFIFHVRPILSDRCFKCHGPDENKIEGNLQLHTEEKAFAALGDQLDKFAIVPGHADSSLLVHRIYTDDPNDIMPPPDSNLKLSNTEKEILKRWIQQGAKWEKHWAFVPPVEQDLPKVSNMAWVKNPIDNFILRKIEQEGLSPSGMEENEKIIRRLSFDLRGLPPDLEDIASFLQDDSEDNYQRIIDKYLDSNAFAERMANDWMDLARYADTHGYQDDLERTMWPWRDWVIHAFKHNMPYDEFVSWQLAGDLMPNASKEQLVATAFNRNHRITQEGGVIPEEYRVEYVSDRTNTFGTAFLGLTFECAKCHDHKYDPIKQKEYYQLFSYFNNVEEKGLIDYGEIPKPYVEITKDDIHDDLSFINNRDTLDTIRLMVMDEMIEPRKSYILDRGIYDQTTEQVKPEVPTFGERTTDTNYNDRLALANWLFEDDHPLTARVQVNRMWQQIFGKGLVSSSYDFGVQGSLPTHPQLLDHLALTFIKEAWDIKKMIKYFVSSATYRQDNKVSQELLNKDPENNLLARSSRSRLPAEMVRDHALAISGLLVEEIGGPSVKPYQPDGLWNEVTGGGGGSTARYIQDEGTDNYRRSMYTFWKRTVPPPNMMLFDTPTRDFCSVKRENTSTPLQALVLMNDPQFLETSAALAYRSVSEHDAQTVQVIEHMFKLATSRKPNQKELDGLLNLFDDQVYRFKANEKAAQQLLAYCNLKKPEIEDEINLAAYSFIANTIFNLDETIRKS